MVVSWLKGPGKLHRAAHIKKTPKGADPIPRYIHKSVSPLHNTLINHREVAGPFRSWNRLHPTRVAMIVHVSRRALLGLLQSWLCRATRGGRHSSRARDMIELSRRSDEQQSKRNRLAHPNLWLPDVFDDRCEVVRGLTGRARGSLGVHGLAGARPNLRRQAMKTIVSSLIALSVLAGIASISASAFDAKTFYEQQDRSHY
jgi:hypothetical protein